MKDKLLYKQVIINDYYFNKKRDAEAYAEQVRKVYKGIVLYIGTNYDKRIPYDYRVSAQIEKKAKL